MLTKCADRQSLCKRWELFFVKPGVKVNGQHKLDILLSKKCQTLSDTLQMIIFRSGRQHCACNTVSTNTVFEWKMWYSCFPVLPGSAEAQDIGGNVLRHLLNAYFIGNISIKNYQNPFMWVKVIASLRWDVFLDMVYIRNTRWRKAAILKIIIDKSLYLCNCLTDRHEVWHGNAYDPYWPLRFRTFKNSRWRTAATPKMKNLHV